MCVLVVATAATETAAFAPLRSTSKNSLTAVKSKRIVAAQANLYDVT
jgi:hypothetical protein